MRYLRIMAFRTAAVRSLASPCSVAASCSKPRVASAAAGPGEDRAGETIAAPLTLTANGVVEPMQTVSVEAQVGGTLDDSGLQRRRRGPGGPGVCSSSIRARSRRRCDRPKRRSRATTRRRRTPSATPIATRRSSKRTTSRSRRPIRRQSAAAVAAGDGRGATSAAVDNAQAQPRLRDDPRADLRTHGASARAARQSRARERRRAGGDQPVRPDPRALPGRRSRTSRRCNAARRVADVPVRVVDGRQRARRRGGHAWRSSTTPSIRSPAR